MMKARVVNNVLELIGDTPLVRLNKVVEEGMAEVLGKLESFNPGGSVKDRICLSMIEEAEGKGLLKPGAIVVEPTSGNTGIGLAMVAAVKGYKCILTMPETMSVERRYILESYGAEIVLTPGIEGMKGALKKAEEIIKNTPNAFMPQQFKNPANPEVHRRTTAKEILTATEGKLDAFVAGVGTGGTITGTGEILKKEIPSINIIAVEPASPDHKLPGMKRITGLDEEYIPKILDRSVIDETVQVTDEDAYRAAIDLAIAVLEGVANSDN